MKEKNISILSSHPVQYKVPLFKEISDNSNFNLIVYFESDKGSKNSFYDNDLKAEIKWDIPLLEGYDYKFLNTKFSIFSELFKSNHDYILISSYSKLTSWFTFLVARLTGTKILFRGETDSLQKRSILKRFFKKILISFFLKRVDAILYSFELNKQYYKNFGVAEEKLFFFPCAVDNERFQNSLNNIKKERNKLRQNLDIKDNDFVVGFTGKLIKRKRPIDLLKAFEKINKDRIRTHLLFVGSGELGENLKEVVKENNIENVHFVGFKNQSELPYYYNIMDLFVLPSEKDPSPKVLNEAMNFKLPIITTNKVGTGPDMIKGEGAGFIYEVGNVDELKEKISKIIRDNKLHDKLSKNSFSAISNTWNFDNDIKGLKNALNYLEKNK